MSQTLYRELLSKIHSAERQSFSGYEDHWTVAVLRTSFGRVIPVTEDTEEPILGMETTLQGVTCLWVISLAGYTCYPEIGFGSSLHELLGSIGMYNPAMHPSAESVVADVILGM